VKAVLGTASSVPTIVVLDEIHALRGAGSHSNSSVDIFESLKGPFASGQLAAIGMSTQLEFDDAFSGDSQCIDWAGRSKRCDSRCSKYLTPGNA
jgi:ATP-dependent Clp protease ATP-binding subunit ClpA